MTISVTVTVTATVTVTVTVTATAGRGRGRSRGRSRNLSGAGKVKNDRLRQPWIIARLARADCIYHSKTTNIYTRHCANSGGFSVSQLKAFVWDG